MGSPADLHQSDSNTQNPYWGMAQSSEDLVYAIDTELHYISFNQAYKNIHISFHQKPPQISQKMVCGSVTDSNGVDMCLLYKRAFAGEEINTEVKFEKQVFLVSLKPIKDNKDRIFGLTAFCRNITQLTESQKRLQESEQKYKYVVDHVTDIVFQTDGQGYWTYLNNAWKNIMEYEVSESIGTLFFSYLHPDDVERNQRLFTPLINREKEYCSHEIRYITKLHEIKWIRVFATLLLNDENEIIGTTGTLKDITAEKENSYRYELLANNVTDLICLHEIDGTFIYVSPSYKELDGVTPQMMQGINPLQYIHPDDLPLIRKHHREIINNETNEAYANFRFQTKKNNYKWYETTVKIIYDEFYGRKLLISSSRNIDKRKLAEQQMLSALATEKQLNDLKSKFVSMASHEFRTPMTAIKTAAEIADIYLSGNEDEKVGKARTHIKNIDQEVDRLTELISNILLLSKIESDSLRLNKIALQLDDTIQKIVKRQNNLQPDKRKVTFISKGIPQVVFLDPLHLTHIVDNLLSNAFKYSIGAKKPELTLTYHPNHFEILIKDYGIGIPIEDQSQIFKSFFRAKNTSGINGTGLGLVLVQNFVAMHGGDISFTSEPGHGSAFKVEIPYKA